MGGDSMKQADNNHFNCRQSKKKRSGVVDFTDSLTKTVAAQLCEDAGFQGFQLSALSALSDVAVRYIREIGRNASSYANSANRSECNVFDVIQGLEDLGSAQGFPGASDVHRCDSSSGVAREVERYVEEAKQIQFAYSIPRFPVVKKWEPQRPSFAQAGVKPPTEHIPSWLPVFPDPEACGSVHLGLEKEVQNGEGKVEAELVEKDKANLVQDLTCVGSEPPVATKEKSSMECNPFLAPPVQNGEGKGEAALVEKEADGARPLANLQQKMSVSEPSVAVNFKDAVNRKRSLACNPFLAPPIQLGDMEGVSPVVIPHKIWDEALLRSNDHGVFDNQISVLDTFAPAIEGLNSGPKIESEDGKKDVIPLNRSSAVKLRFINNRKSFHKGVNSQKHDDMKTISCFANDDTEDGKKRRAEQILKESFESTGAGSLVN